jgi:methionyl aminopeptidase
MAPINRLNPAQGDAAYAAAQVVVETHRRLAEFLRVGLKLSEIDDFVAKQLADQDARSCFVGYTPRRGKIVPFTSHACLSLNECVVHGTRTYVSRPIQQGDLLKIDIGVWHKSWIGDAAWTYSFGPPSPLAKRLMECGKKALAEGVKQMRPDKKLVDWAKVVQDIVEREYGFRSIRGLGGHGLCEGGKAALHGPPFVANNRPEGLNDWPEANDPWTPGMLVAVEPMIAAGTSKVKDKPASRSSSPLPADVVWPEIVADGSLSVHYEHDVLITDGAPRILTEGLEKTPDVIG